MLLDGLGDRAQTRLDNLTPLQAADTPQLDRFAQNGANGLFHATIQGQSLPSENAHFVMFGYDLNDFPGRGVLEALGENISLVADDTALLSHLAHLLSHALAHVHPVPELHLHAANAQFRQALDAALSRPRLGAGGYASDAEK